MGKTERKPSPCSRCRSAAILAAARPGGRLLWNWRGVFSSGCAAGGASARRSAAMLAARPGTSARRWGALLALLFAFCTAHGTRAGDPAVSEYQVKAAYLFNFAKFVDWPASKFTNDNAPLVIGILGANPFENRLDQTIQGKAINGRPLEARNVLKLEDVNQCHILFVGAPETDRLISSLSEIKPEGVLMVGEAVGFAQRGGMINFTLADGTVKFEVNPQAAERAGLKISSKLLSVGKVVKSR